MDSTIKCEFVINSSNYQKFIKILNILFEDTESNLEINVSQNSNGIIEPEVNELMFLRARFSGGFSLRKHDLHFTGGFQEEFSETSFHYAFLAGLGFRWSENFHSLLFYKFDGSTETVNFGHASFHQFGLGFGLDY